MKIPYCQIELTEEMKVAIKCWKIYSNRAFQGSGITTLCNFKSEFLLNLLKLTSSHLVAISVFLSMEDVKVKASRWHLVPEKLPVWPC